MKFAEQSFKSYLIFLAVLISACSEPDSDSHRSGSTDSERNSGAGRPTDGIEGLPGYLVKPDAISLIPQGSNSYRIEGGSGAVKPFSKKEGPVTLEVWAVANKQLDTIERFETDAEVKGLELLTTFASDSSGGFEANFGTGRINDSFTIVLVTERTKKSVINIPKRTEKPTVAIAGTRFKAKLKVSFARLLVSNFFVYFSPSQTTRVQAITDEGRNLFSKEVVNHLGLTVIEREGTEIRWISDAHPDEQVTTTVSGLERITTVRFGDGTNPILELVPQYFLHMDKNNDGILTGIDLYDLYLDFGKVFLQEIDYEHLFDFDNDGDVDGQDYGRFGSAYGLLVNYFLDQDGRFTAATLAMADNDPRDRLISDDELAMFFLRFDLSDGTTRDDTSYNLDFDANRDGKINEVDRVHFQDFFKPFRI